MSAAPLTAAQKVKLSQDALIARGGRRTNLSMQPDVARALDDLISAGYGRTTSAVIAKAVTEAQRRIAKASRPAPL